MNKKMSKALAVALSAAMAASAFAIGTGSAFAAPTTPTAQATLDATKSVPQYLWNDNDKNVNNENTVDTFKVNLNTAYANLGLLNGATLKLEDGSEIKVDGKTVTADLRKATFTTDDDTIVMLKDGEISAVPGATGTATITVSGATVTKGTTTYDVDDFTVDVDVIAPNDYSEGVWSTSASKPTSFTNEVSVGNKVYLYEAKVDVAQNMTNDTFASFSYAPMTAKETPTAGYLDQASANNFEIAEYKNGTFTTQQPGSGSVVYYPSNATATLTPKDSQELTVKGEYSGVTAITKQSDGTYTVTATGGPTNGAYTGLTAENLAAGKFTLDSSVTSIANTDAKAGTPAANAKIKIDTKLGTVTPTASSLNLYGVDIDTVTSDKNVAVNAYSAVAKTNANIPTSIGTIETAGAVTVGNTDTAKNYDTIKVDTIKADNVTVSTNKAEIGAITAKKTANTVTTNTEKGIRLPALKDYKILINTDTTVASVAGTKDATIKDGVTLTVNGTADFNSVTSSTASKGILAIDAGKLTLSKAASSKFTLALTDVKAGETAFIAKDAKKGDYTSNTTSSDTTSTGALQYIKTPGYTAVADDKGNAIIDKTIVAGGVKDATTGAVYNAQTGEYDLEINDDEPTTLAVQPVYADDLSKNQTVQWQLVGASGGNVTLNNLTSSGAQKSGLTATVIGDYQKNYPSKNKFKVTASMPNGGAKVTYNITIVNEKTQATTDFSLSLGANYVQPGETMEVYATPNGNQSLTDVTFTSSDPSVAMVQSKAQVNNVWSAKVAGIKDGTATITAVATLQNGQQVTKTIDVTVTSTPVLAYVDGKLVGPTDMIDVAQSTSKDVTFFSANGKTISSFNYVTGNGKVIGTNTLNVWNGTSGAYQVYAAGKVGEATGIYVNGQKVFMAKVTERPFTSDTTMNVNLPVGKTYSFKISLEDKSAPFTFTTANGTALSTSYNKAYYPDANGDYLCTIKAEKAVGGVGVYVNIAGVNYKVFTAVTQ